jgi:3-phenylpropionate/cinnamic acid dioxygenase small subunit
MQAKRITSGLSALDEREIRAVLIAYATGIDQRDWALFRSLFTPDCEVDYGSFGKWHGSSAITEYMKTAHSDLGQTLHRISNIEVGTVDGQVVSRCYVDAFLKPMNDSGPTHRGLGYYDDQFARSANGWQIARRKFHALHLE